MMSAFLHFIFKVQSHFWVYMRLSINLYLINL
ncbi:hypothetical protein J2Z17_000865 [Rhizobium halophytocola]|uniref:Uncharacterized protein n=1 Tax=Rhizobium halophytocola TaxID=735519 RepID=A0ABS4DUT3_9HYPH|nr:hypothetical protein [Rhizobium halophytocola]